MWYNYIKICIENKFCINDVGMKKITLCIKNYRHCIEFNESADAN